MYLETPIKLADSMETSTEGGVGKVEEGGDQTENKEMEEPEIVKEGNEEKREEEKLVVQPGKEEGKVVTEVIEVQEEEMKKKKGEGKINDEKEVVTEVIELEGDSSVEQAPDEEEEEVEEEEEEEDDIVVEREVRLEKNGQVVVREGGGVGRCG